MINVNLFVGNDMELKVDGLRNASTGSAINNATVTASVTDSTGTTVGGMSFPLTLNYVSGSDGDYSGTLEDTTSLVAGSVYTVTINISGDSLTGKFTQDLPARHRRF